MQYLKDIFWFLQPTTLQQSYKDDRRYIYNLIYIDQNGNSYSRIFSTSIPLAIGHRIVLSQRHASLVVKHIAHLIYTPATEDTLTRDTTFVHAGVYPAPESEKPFDLKELGFAEYRNEFISHMIH